jgi:hypothetical protein
MTSERGDRKTFAAICDQEEAEVRINPEGRAAVQAEDQEVRRTVHS